MEQRILDKIVKDLPKNYLSKYGGSLGGALNFYNNTWNKVGDDVAIGDCNIAGRLGIKGLNGKTGIHFTPESGAVAQDLYVDGAGTMTISGKLSSTFVGNLTGNVTGSSSSAGKLSTARNIALSGDLTGSVNFDGSSNVTLDAFGYSCSVIKNNTNNYPFCRIAHCEGTGSFSDKSITLYISQSFAGGSFGILRVCIRSEDQEKTSNPYCHGEVIWLVRHGFEIDQFQLGVMNVKGNWSADLFYKCNNVYASLNVKQLEASGRTKQGRTWTLINCSEPPGTVTTKNNTTNCYPNIASYKTYSNIVTATDVLLKGMKKQINSSVDFNSITENGIYKVQDCRSSANKPDGYVYGILNVYKPIDDEENRIVQIYYPHNSYPIMVRWNNKGWSNWYRIGKGTRWEDIPDRPGLASSTADGLLSKSDKSKLDAINNTLKNRVANVGSDGTTYGYIKIMSVHSSAAYSDYSVIYTISDVDMSDDIAFAKLRIRSDFNSNIDSYVNKLISGNGFAPDDIISTVSGNTMNVYVKYSHQYQRFSLQIISESSRTNTNIASNVTVYDQNGKIEQIAEEKRRPINLGHEKTATGGFINLNGAIRMNYETAVINMDKQISKKITYTFPVPFVHTMMFCQATICGSDEKSFWYASNYTIVCRVIDKKSVEIEVRNMAKYDENIQEQKNSGEVDYLQVSLVAVGY